VHNPTLDVIGKSKVGLNTSCVLNPNLNPKWAARVGLCTLLGRAPPPSHPQKFTPQHRRPPRTSALEPVSARAAARAASRRAGRRTTGRCP
jgi:hypothetical protein